MAKVRPASLGVARASVTTLACWYPVNESTGAWRRLAKLGYCGVRF